MSRDQQLQALSLRYEWESPGAIRDAGLAATWVRLELTVGDEFVTQVEDRESGSTRRAIYTSLLPLAEWITWNWWAILGHRRGDRLVGGISKPHPVATIWEKHNLRGAGEGMAWPNLVLLPEGSVTRVQWFADRSGSSSPVRFTNSGVAYVSAERLEKTLRDFVDSVVERLQERGVRDSALQTEWEQVRTTPPEERAFCLAAAALDLDPYNVPSEVSARMIEVSNRLGETDAEQLFNAIRPQQLAAALKWITTALAGAPTSAASPEVLAARESVMRIDRAGLPWLVGWREAAAVRSELGLEPTARFDPSSFFPTSESASPDPALIAVGTWRKDRGALVLGRKSSPVGKRFAQARAVRHAVAAAPTDRFLITDAETEAAQIERAFAAELLVPAEGLRELLGGLIDRGPDSQIDEVAEHYGVSSRVVVHQVENQLLAA